MNVTYRFPYTPTGDSGSPFASSHRSGRHSSESPPHTAGLLGEHIGRVSTEIRLVPGTAHKLYPYIEAVTKVPLGTGREWYTFPEIPTTGFESGMTSSFRATRGTSTEGEWILNVSWMSTG